MGAPRLPRRATSKRGPRAGPAQKRVTAKPEASFPVVAIGASAGGLNAFRTLLAALPAKSANVLNQMPKSLHARTKGHLQDIAIK